MVDRVRQEGMTTNTRPNIDGIRDMANIPAAVALDLEAARKRNAAKARSLRDQWATVAAMRESEAMAAEYDGSTALADFLWDRQREAQVLRAYYHRNIARAEAGMVWT